MRPAPSPEASPSPAERASPAGETLANRYRVLGTLGRGGMGEVLRVEDLLHEGRILALKRFRVAADREALGFLREEFLTLAKLRHPNLATVYDFGTFDDEAYFTAELVDGTDLFAATATAGWDEVYDLLVQVCRGLAYVHSRGIIHRDVKPSNVLVTAERVVKLIDFGLASLVAAAAPSDAPIRGTVHYLAPETIRGAPVDRRADLYSLGVMAFEVATRRRPFPGLTSRDVIRGHLADPPPRPRTVRPEVPAALDEVIARLLEKDPELRYATADEVIAALGRLTGRRFPVRTRETNESWVLSGRFVGRERETAWLRAWFAALFGEAKDAPARPLALVTGEPGIGKSRLLRELRHHVQAEAAAPGGRPVETIEVQCEESGRAYGPIAEAVRRLLKLAGDAGDALLGASAPLVRRFAGAPLPATAGADPADEDAGRERLRLFDAVVTFLIAATWRRPALLIIHDLHRADAGTVALLAHIARTIGFAARARSGERPGLAVCATARTAHGARLPAGLEADVAPLEDEDFAEVLALAPLADEDVALLAASMLGLGQVGDAALPAELERFLARHTGGNPFFLEEVMKSLLESGTVEIEGGALRVGPLDAQRVPRTVTDAFRERLARLGREETRALEALAVAGRPVGVDLVARAAGGEREALRQRLFALEERGLVLRETGGEESRYFFAQDLLREAVYAAVPEPARRALHAAVAEALEAEAAPDPAPLADHLAAAGMPAKAFRYALLAAGEAASLFANERAIAYYERALALARDAGAARSEVAGALEALGRTAERIGAHERAAACYREVLEAADAEALLGPTGIARLYRRLGATCETRGEYDLALESFGAGIRLLGAANRLASPEGAKLRGAIASVYVKLGLYDDAIAFCKSGLALLEAAPAAAPGAAEERASAAESAALHNTLGIALSGKGAYEAAARHFERSLALRERLDEPEEVAKALNNLGAVHVERGQVGRAIAFFEQALERGERTGDLRGTAETAANLGAAYSSLGDDERALRHLARGLELRERLGDPEGIAASQNALAALECELGEYESAFARLERARRVVRRLGETRESVATEILAARLLAAVGALGEARAALEEAMRLATRFAGKRDEAEALHLLGRLEAAGGLLEEAERSLNRSLTIYRGLGNEVEGALVTIDVLEVLRARGDLDLARMIREKVEESARGLRAGRLLPPLELAAGRLALAAGAFGEAARRLEHARELAREGRRPELAWRAEHALGLACERAGAPEKAFGFYVRAMEGVRELYRRVPARFREAYLADPDRRALREDFQRLR